MRRFGFLAMFVLALSVFGASCTDNWDKNEGAGTLPEATSVEQKSMALTTNQTCISETACTSDSLSIPEECFLDGWCDVSGYCAVSVIVSDTCAIEVAETCTIETVAVDCSDDGNPCTTNMCGDDGLCHKVFNIESCDDGNACTVGDTCALGECVPGGGELDCDDGNVCTTESCQPALGGCVYAPNDALCDDGNACTDGDICTDGVCVPGAVMDCNDNNVCTDDACDEIDGCTHNNNTAPCNDNDVCTDGDVCADGACVPGGALDCDDGVDCTDDGCDAVDGCSHVPNDALCDDGNACTMGTCDAVAGCSLVNLEDGTACADDGVCRGGLCLHPNTPCEADVDCAEAFSYLPSYCTENPVCDAGMCGAFFLDAEECGGPTPECVADADCPDDGDNEPCTIMRCDLGTCVPGLFTCGVGQCIHDPQDPALPTCALLDCDDDVACTDDVLIQYVGCSNTPDDALCDDGVDCTDDACDAVAGCSHVPDDALCDDDDASTTDTCDAVEGCQHAPAPTSLIWCWDAPDPELNPDVPSCHNYAGFNSPPVWNYEDGDTVPYCQLGGMPDPDMTHTVIPACCEGGLDWDTQGEPGYRNCTGAVYNPYAPPPAE